LKQVPSGDINTIIAKMTAQLEQQLSGCTSRRG
jgi:hypothetical protein